MSNLTKLRETEQFIAAYLAAKAPRFIIAAAHKQRANYETVKMRHTLGINPHWCDLDEYRQCVELLEEEAEKYIECDLCGEPTHRDGLANDGDKLCCPACMSLVERFSD